MILNIISFLVVIINEIIYNYSRERKEKEELKNERIKKYSVINIILNAIRWVISVFIISYRTLNYGIDASVIAYIIVASTWQFDLLLQIIYSELEKLKSELKDK